MAICRNREINNQASERTDDHVGRSRQLRILLVMPDADIHRLAFGGFRMSCREAPLTLTTLAALIPPEINADVALCDESVERLPEAQDFDLVAISCLTGTAPRAYEIADRFRARGSTVVLGGIHVALRPEEAARHGDCIVIGFAEQTWPMLLRDFVGGGLKPVYHQETVDLAGLPHPRRDLQKRFGYSMPQTVFATRGCRQQCEFCTVPAMPFGWHTRPVAEVVAEVAALRGRRFVFNDVNLVSDREYALTLFHALAPLKKKWGGLAPVSLASDPELLGAAAASGCQYLLVGFESVRQSSLGQINKTANQASGYRDAVAAFHRHGIVIQGCFIFGMDGETPEIFAETVKVVRELRIDIPRFAIYTPYPGTAAFARLQREGRLLHENWEYYDTRHVVFKPARMTPEELYRGFQQAYRQTFSRRAILRRVISSPHPLITLLGNAAYRIFTRRVCRQPCILPERNFQVQPAGEQEIQASARESTPCM